MKKEIISFKDLINKDFISQIILKELNNIYKLSEEIFYMDIYIVDNGLFNYGISNFGTINFLPTSTILGYVKYLLDYNNIINFDTIKVKYLIEFDNIKLINSFFNYFNINLEPYHDKMVLSFTDNTNKIVGYCSHVETRNKNEINFYLEDGTVIKKKLSISMNGINTLLEKLFLNERYLRRINYANL